MTIPGTTPTHIFKIKSNLDITSIKKLLVVYAQDEKVLFEKTENDCEITENEIKVRLSQEETLLFDFEKFVEIQLQILTHGNDSLKSRVIKFTVGECLRCEVFE